MPVPKRKTSKSRRDQRSACKFLRPQAFTLCSNCAVVTLPHIVCSSCGFYKGRKIFTTKLDRDLRRREKQEKLQKQTQTQAEPESISQKQGPANT